MLDLETLSVRPDAAVVIIGAVKFSRNGDLQPLDKLDTFYRRIDINSCIEAGLRVEQETINWWNTQAHDVKYEALQHPDRVPLKQALREFTAWMKPCDKVWANSPSFDCVILESAYARCGVPAPWKFWNTRDVRTIFALAGIRKYDLPDGGEHHALHDCYRQIVGVKRALKKLGL